MASASQAALQMGAKAFEKVKDTAADEVRWRSVQPWQSCWTLVGWTF